MRTELACVKLLKEKSISNDNLQQLLELFLSKPDFDIYVDVTKQSPKCIKLLLRFSVQFIGGCQLLDAMKLIEERLIIVRRDQSTNEFVQYSKLVSDKDENNQIYIRYGQLNEDGKLHGVGRKISLKPIYFSQSQFISDFDKDKTYIEEGELNMDELNGTFGRKVEFNGDVKLGWFLEGSKLHGYGVRGKDEKGHYVNGEHTIGDVKLYDAELDFIAKHIDFKPLKREIKAVFKEVE